MNAEIKRMFRLEVTTLDRIQAPTTADPSSIFVHETHGTLPPLPPHARWCDSSDLDKIELAVPGQLRVLTAWLAANDNARAEQTLPWTDIGWNAAASAWISTMLQESGVSAAGPVEQMGFRAWSRHSRVRTATGWVYFKASAPVFTHEPAVTQLLAQWFPEHLPRVIAVDANRGWMMTADFGDVPRRRSGAELLADYLAVAPRLARIQRHAAGAAPAIAILGCPDHRLETLPEQFCALVLGVAARASPRPGGHSQETLSDAEVNRLVTYIPEFARRCAALAELGIPESIAHLDIWRGNFAVRNGEVLIFDWAESVVGHPLFSLDKLLRDVRTTMPNDLSAPAQVAAAYMNEWAEDLPADRWTQALRLAAAPAIVSRALLWRAATESLSGERRRIYADAVTAHMREALTNLEEAP
ncbi:hypothetical protein Rhe02_69720 [Rhizocola hellebori]|uniref:Aminoglycoside phosphotransferase domain-containing protein n=2 Tax=Rhizocola hellebori TaxID=1392758 RepID=A0A8J3VJP0_9ACTN|nr:hypothetical protein Rhe02_69720 [Rhizocola hellebori]